MRFNVYETDEFRRWLTDLRDREARAKILVRLRRLSLGNCGDVRRLREDCLNSAWTMVRAIACMP